MTQTTDLDPFFSVRSNCNELLLTNRERKRKKEKERERKEIEERERAKTREREREGGRRRSRGNELEKLRQAQYEDRTNRVRNHNNDV